MLLALRFGRHEHVILIVAQAGEYVVNARRHRVIGRSLADGLTILKRWRKAGG